MPDLFDLFRVIDVDTHLTEPPDIWTARMPAALHDKMPHVERRDRRDVWVADGNCIGAPGLHSMAGFDGVLPAQVSATYDDIAPASYDNTARIAFLDEEALAIDAINRFPDNILYETDCQHSICQHPGSRTSAQRPRDYARRALGGLTDDLLEKVLHGNAACVHGLA